MREPLTFLDERVALYGGDCFEILKQLPSNSLDSCCCDPPYHLTSVVRRFGAADAAPCKAGATGAYARASRGFMGQTWDGGDIAFRPELWAEVMRVLKPGAHLVAFSGTRTYHRMACAIEDAGFEIRDMTLDLLASDTHVAAFLATLDHAQREAFARCVEESGFGGMLAWIYGSGFPKSHDVERGTAVATCRQEGRHFAGRLPQSEDRRPSDHVCPMTPESLPWDGWGTALKPALEPICLARKPLSEVTVAANVLRWGTGALNVDGCRVGTEGGTKGCTAGPSNGILGDGLNGAFGTAVPGLGRWPANVVTDGSDEVVGAFPCAPGQQRSVLGVERAKRTVNAYGNFGETRHGMEPRADTGSAARFFYSAKADADDRIGSKHPTVKPVDLMRWLVRMVTPPGGTVLDSFAGTGTTGEAAWREGFSAVLIEREAAYQADIARRMALCLAGPEERARAIIKARHGDLPAGPLFDIVLAEAAE